MALKKLSNDDCIVLADHLSIDVEKSKKRGRKVKKYYVNPIEFSEQIVCYYGDGRITDEIAQSILDIATRLGFSPNFIRYTYKDDMIGDAIIKMMQALESKKFDPKKGNPFSYYTKIAYHAFINRIKKEKRIHQAVNEYQQKVFDNLMENDIIPRESYGCDSDDDGYNDYEDRISQNTYTDETEKETE